MQTYSDTFKTRLAEQLCRPGMDVLDIGTGKVGRVVLPLMHVCRSMTGVDFDPDVIASLRGKVGSNVSLLEADAQKLPVENSAFDLVFCYSTLAHVSNPASVLSHIRRAMRPTARAVIDVRGKLNPNVKFWSDYYRSSGAAIHEWTLQEAVSMLQSFGFRISRYFATGMTRGHLYMKPFSDMPWLTKALHSGKEPDLDFRLSNLPIARRFASSWYFVCT